jgi:cyanophycin synthetase
LPEFDIRLVDLTFLRGPNRWSYRPALEALVDIGELEEWPSNRCPHLISSLKTLLPGLAAHECSYEEPGGFLRRLEEGTWPAHILEHVTLELLDLTGHKVGFGRARSAGERGLYYVIVRSPQFELTRECLEVARRLLVSLYRGEAPSLTEDVEKLRGLSKTLSPPPAMARLRTAAERARTPVQRFDHSDLLVLGQGSRQRRVWRGTTDGTSAIADGIARDKGLLLRLLREAGTPTAQPVEVSTVDELLQEAEEEGGRFVVKAARSTGGQSVSLDVSKSEDIRRAGHRAFEFDSSILLERFIAGSEFELLVIGGRVVSTVRESELMLVGDGKNSVQDLVSGWLEKRLRGPWSLPMSSVVAAVVEAPASRLALSKAGLRANEPLTEGKKVTLTVPASFGGTPVLTLHDRVARAAVTAVRIVGLDMAAVTLVAPDVDRPLEESGGAIIGVCASPSWLSHLPFGDTKQDVAADALLQHLVPLNEGARVPVVLVSGAEHSDGVVDLLSYFLRIAGKKVGSAGKNGIRQGARITQPGTPRFDDFENLLFSRSVDTIVMHTPIDNVLREGLPSDRSLISVITTLENAPLSPQLPNVDSYGHLMRTLVDVVLPGGAAVLNADDARVRSLAEYCDGEVIFYGTHKSDAFLEEHATRGGRSLGLRSGRLVLRSGNFSLERPVGNQVAPEVWLPAFAAALKLELSPELLIGALHSKDWNQESPTQRRGRKDRASRPDL